MRQQYDEPGNGGPHKCVQVGDDMCECGAQIETLAICVRQDTNRDQVDHRAERGNRQNQATGDVLRRNESLDSLYANDDCNGDKKCTVRRGCENLRSLEPIGPSLPGRSLGHFDRPNAERQRGHVGHHVSGVGIEDQGIPDDRSDDFSGKEQDYERQRYENQLDVRRGFDPVSVTAVVVILSQFAGGNRVKSSVQTRLMLSQSRESDFME